MKPTKLYAPLLALLLSSILFACTPIPGDSQDFFYANSGLSPVGASDLLLNVPEGKVPVVTDIFLKNGNPEPVDPSVFSAITITAQRADGVQETIIAGIRAVGNELTHLPFSKGIRQRDEVRSIRVAFTVGTAGVISVRIAGYFEDIGE